MRRSWLVPAAVSTLLALCPVVAARATPLVGVQAAAQLPPVPYGSGATFVPLRGHRVLDTTTGLGHGGPVGPGAAITFAVTGVGGVPRTGVSAVALELTAVSPTADGFVQAYPAGQTRPAAHALSTTAGRTTTTLIVVRPGTNGRVALYNNSGTVNLRAETVGYAKAPDWVVAENARRGTTAWRLGSEGPSDAIVGYADRTSVSSGQSFGLYVSTTAPSWKVTAYRIGWYRGTGGRRVWSSAWVSGTAQPSAITDGSTHTVTTTWQRSMTIATRLWPSGSYLLKLHSSAGHERYVPITIRSATAVNRMVVMNEDMMWQAYNTWGGRSLYTGPGGYAGRSYKVSGA